jgi:hypothetical protein
MIAAGKTGEKSLVLTGIALLPQALTNKEAMTSVASLGACWCINVNLAMGFTCFNHLILFKWFN